MRRHIREQIIMRINSMDVKCFEDGSCKECGCMTTHLQMANKACDKPCYPKMVSKKVWRYLTSKDGQDWAVNVSNQKFYKIR